MAPAAQARLKLGILIGRFPPGVVGGAEIQAEAWAERLAADHDVSVITRLDPPEQPAIERRHGYQVMRFRPATLPVWRTLADLLRIKRFVHRMTPPADVLLCFQTFISGLAGVVAAPRGSHVIVWIRGEEEYRLGRSAVHRWIGLHVWKRASMVLVQSDTNRSEFEKELREHAPPVADRILGKTRVLPNGLELPRPPFQRRGDVLAVGRLIQHKGMDVVIRAVAAAGLPLTIAGGGPEREALERLAVECGARVRFAGLLDRERLAAEYARASCVVLAARRGEGLPNVLLEAMAWARPVIATPVGGVVDLIEHERNGLLVDRDDVQSVRAALMRLVDEPALADRLSARARSTAEGFAWDRVYPLLARTLQEIAVRNDAV